LCDVGGGGRKHTHTHSHTHVHTHKHTSHAHTSTRTHTHTHTHTHTYTHIHVHTRTHTHVLTRVHARTCTRQAGPEPFPVVTYTRALALVRAHAAQHPRFFGADVPAWGDALGSEHEKWLAGQHFRSPVFVVNYPAAIKPFYMRLNDYAAHGASPSGSDSNNSSNNSSNATCSDSSSSSSRIDDKNAGAANSSWFPFPRCDDAAAHGPTVACFDLLLPDIGELCGGSQREERYEHLLARMKHDKMNVDSYSW
jgi:asparaginyl-tRNA synthetase